MNHLLLAAALFAAASLTFFAGICLGSALANQRFADRCRRCQALYDSVHATPGSVIRVSRGAHHV
jgi:hypothetical protein